MTIETGDENKHIITSKIIGGFNVHRFKYKTWLGIQDQMQALAYWDDKEEAYFGHFKLCKQYALSRQGTKIRP